MHRAYWLALFLLVAALASAPAATAAQQRDEAAEIERVERMLDEALAALREFQRAGGQDGAPDHPAHDWAARLWAYYQEHRGTAAASLAAGEALHQWLHAGQLDRLYAEARALPPDDPAWERVVDVLGEAAALSGDDAALREIAESFVARTPNAALEEKVRMTLARLYLDAGEPERARLHYQRVMEMDRPGSRAPEQARTALYQIENLSPGRPAPEFAARSTAGEEIRLAALRGHPVLIIFWASW